MDRPDRATQAHRALVDATAAAIEFCGCDAHKAVIGMLDALEASYLTDLLDVRPEGLVALQSAMKQAAAIRDVLAGAKGDLPKI